jgi:hypothetical protein
LSIAAAPRPTFGRVTPHTMRPIAQAQRAIQMLMYRHGAAGQRRSPPYFMTSEKGFRLATSVGGVLTGRGADFIIIIIDDPLKPDEALSETQRNAVNNWYDHTLSSRLNDKRTGCIILIMQRLHEDDLVGHVLPQGDWRVLKFPAIAEESEGRSITASARQIRVQTRSPSAYLQPYSASFSSLRTNIFALKEPYLVKCTQSTRTNPFGRHCT